MSYKNALKELKEMHILDPRRSIQFQLLLDCEKMVWHKELVEKDLLDKFMEKIKDIKEDEKIKDIQVRRQEVHDKLKGIFIELTY